MKNFPKVFVIVLNYNNKETLLACLKSVYQSDYQNFEVVVVDNNSTDGSFELAKQNFSNAHFIKSPQNLGFGMGNNLGIRFALEKFASYIMLLNSDAYLQKTTLSRLVVEAEKKEVSGLVSPVIKKPDQEIWFAGGKIDWIHMKTKHLFKPKQQEESYESEYLTGCALLVKKSVFEKIGLFDEKFFLYYEDADFSLRAKKAGFFLLVLPSAVAIHDEKSEQLKGQKIYWLVLSGLIFFQKNAPAYLKPWIFCYVLMRKMKNFFKFHLNKNSFAADVRKAYQDFKKNY